MFCKPPHPVYIVLFRGDDTDFVGNQEIVVKITTERDISGCKAYFKYMGNIQTFDEIPEDKELHLVFSREQTKDMPLGTWDAELYLIDENGKRMTVNNRIHMLVTNSVREAYFPDDPQAVSVVISANKYIEDAEVSADGKTLTLTKKDGTEVSFSGGGGGGTNDYNDLENKPSINGATLTGNINLATPEQLSSKADKSALDNHEENTNNPHRVTAAQVGTYTTGEIDEKLAAKADEFTAWEIMDEGEPVINSRLVWTSAGWVFQIQLNDSWHNASNPKGDKDDVKITWGLNEWTGTPNTLTATRKRILYTGDSVSIGESTGGGGTIEVKGNGSSIKKNGKEVATESYVDAKVENSVLPTNPTFSNAVLAVGLNIDTNSVAVLNDIAATFGGFPIEGTATTVGGLLAALAAAIAWLKKNKVGSFASVGGATATVDNGVAKLDDFFTNSNSLLTATIDARLPYPLYAVPSTGLLKDRALNTTRLDSVTVPDNFTDLLVRASVASSLSVTMPDAIATKYGDTFPSEAGDYLITITKTGAAEAYVRTIKLEEVA